VQLAVRNLTDRALPHPHPVAGQKIRPLTSRPYPVVNPYALPAFGVVCYLLPFGPRAMRPLWKEYGGPAATRVGQSWGSAGRTALPIRVERGIESVK